MALVEGRAHEYKVPVPANSAWVVLVSPKLVTLAWKSHLPGVVTLSWPV